MPEPELNTLDAFLRTIVSLVAHHTPIPEIRWIDDMMEVKVSPEDQGRVIGKDGLMIWAIGTLVARAALRVEGRQVYVKLRDPAARIESPKIPFRARPTWDASRIERAMAAISSACFDDAHWKITPSGSRAQVEMLIAARRDQDVEEAVIVVAKAVIMAAGAAVESVTIEWKAP